MAVPVIASTSTATTGGVEDGELSFTEPTGLAAGDLILILAVNENTNTQSWPAVSSPDAYNQIAHANNSEDVQASIYWRICTGDETWPLVIDCGTTFAVGWCHRITGVAQTGTINQTGTWAGVGTTGANLTVTEVTTDVAECLGICLVGTDGADLTPATITSGAGWGTVSSLEDDAGTAGAGVGASHTTKSITSAGASVDVVWDFVGTGTDGRVGIQIAIAPLPAGLVLPGAGSSTLTTYAPSRGTGLRLTGEAPTASIESGGVNHVIEVPSGSLSVSSEAPSVLVSVSVQPDGAVLVLTGLQPVTVQGDHQIRAPPAGSIALTGLQPTALAGESKTVQPGVGGLSFTNYAPSRGTGLKIEGYAPAVLFDGGVEPDAGSIALTGLQPTLSATDHKTAEPDAGSVALTGLQPTASQSANLVTEPDIGGLGLSGHAPEAPHGPGLRLIGLAPTISIDAVDGNVTAQPGAGSLSLTTYAPSMVNSGDTEIVAEPGVGSLTITGEAPALEIYITGAESSLYFQGYAPTVSVTGLHWVSPGVGSLSLTGLQPFAQSGDSKFSQPDSGSLSLTGNAPSLAITENHVSQPGAGSYALTGIAPSTLIEDQSVTVTPDAGSVSLTGYSPVTSITTDHVVQPGAGALRITGYAPGPPGEPEDDRTTGGYGAINGYNAYRQRKRRREEERKRILSEIEKIKDDVDREIAKLLQKTEAKAQEERDVQELGQVVSRSFSNQELARIKEYSNEVARAYLRAVQQGNYSALKAFEREMEQVMEEEEFILMAVVLYS